MAELVGGAFLNSFLNVLFDRMATPQFMDLFRTGKMDRKLLQKLKTYLKTVNAVLYDAEYKQIASQDAFVKDFLDDLKDAAYEADDLLDLIAYEVTATEIQADQRANSNNRAGKLSSLRNRLMKKASVNYHSEEVIIPGDVSKKIEDIVEILELLVQQIDPLGLKKSDKRDALPHREPTSHVVEESDIVGRRNEKDAIIQFLEAAGRNGIEVIPIVGMGGIGKTTLAQLVYNDSKAEELFATRAWVCVSDNYDGSRIKKELLQQVNISMNCDRLTPQKIDEELKKSLADKKYLIVLDDMWDNGYNNWDRLQQPLKSGARGSTIIVTTRIEKIASMMSTVRAIHLSLLSDDSCWQLFAKHAFNNGEGDHSLQLFREDILRKCGGLPLAAKMLGGVMRGKQEVAEWDAILKSKIWEIDCGVIPVLMLSYQHLPSHLKQCFAYCAIFPQDYKIRKEELIQLWMAECFVVTKRGGRESIEKLGEKYLQELVSRSFFQEHNDQNDGSYFLMHDLINDLAQHISGEFLVRMDEDSSCKFSTRNRYFSFKISNENSSNMLSSIRKAQFLRTFWSRGESDFYTETKKIVDEVVTDLRCLRVLSLRNFYGLKLPKSIKHLKHLRYLNLANTSVKRLPKTVCSLYNLLTLILYECYRLVELPKNIVNLINLHSLDIRGTSRLRKMPPGMGNLKELRTLGKFIIGKQNGCDIDELRKLQHLRGELHIFILQNVAEIQNVGEIPKDSLKNKMHLEDLTLEWTHWRKGFCGKRVVDSEHEERVLDRLQPCASINNLSIFGYGGKKLSDWVGDSSYTEIVSLELNGCKYCTILPEFDKLPSLEHLSISNCDAVRKVSMTKPLCSLKTLSTRNMGQWEEWSFCEENDFGNCGLLEKLETLIIEKCPKLNAISPSGPTQMIFRSLNSLIVERCPNLKISNIVAISNFKQLAKESKPPNPSRLKSYYLNAGVILEQLPSAMYGLYVRKLTAEGIEEMGIALNALEDVIRESDLCECIPLEEFPALKSLRVEDCHKLKSLSASAEPLPQPLMSLASLKISFCDSLICFPKEGYQHPI